MPTDKNDDLLTEIRERFQVCTDAWQDIRDEAQKDMRYIAGDPWDPEERRQREKAKRPCLALDELGQYVNQLINSVRQNPVSIKVNPSGDVATDKKAEFVENMIRGIEYKSKAQSAYTTGFENAAQRSYGYWRVSKKYVLESSSFEDLLEAGPKAAEQELVIKRIPNPDTVWIDPDCKEADASDMEFAFITDLVRRKEFKRKYPKAEIVDFKPEHAIAAPQWIRQDHIQVAEYWKIKKKYRKMLIVQGKAGPTAVFEDELKGQKPEILSERMAEERTVCQYITNGVEILEENEWEGKYIPIVSVFGKELYLDDGSGSKRILMSLVRLARDPYMLYCYLRTKEAEEAAMTPLAPWEAYDGQLEGHEDEWQNANKVPIAVLYAKAKLDATGDSVLPLPSRTQFIPNFQQYEIAAEAARRAIQSAMGTSPLPTAAQRRNEKSGVALQRIETQQDQGSFHFIDNFKHSLEHTGRIIVDLIPYVYDTERTVPLRKADETHEVGKLSVDPQSQEVGEHQGEFDVAVTTGPNSQTQREEVSDFANTLVQNIEALPLQPEQKAQMLALIVKLRNMGPLGDQIAEIVFPQDQNSPQALMGKIQQGAQQMQAMHAYAQQLEQVVQKLQTEKQGKVIEGEYRLQTIKMQEENKLAIAEITTKFQDMQQRLETYMDMIKQFHDQAHEAGLQAQDQAHERDMAAQQHQQALEQGQQQHGQALEQQDQAGVQQQQLAAQQAESSQENQQ